MVKRILITDDSKSWLYFETELLYNLYGETVDVVSAVSATGALNCIQNNKNNPFDVIITDLQMETDFEPLLAGEWLIERVREIKEYSNTPIVIVSAMSSIKIIAQKYGLECIAKYELLPNKLLMKFMLENLLPDLKTVENT